jgi:hypothetical protein
MCHRPLDARPDWAGASAEEAAWPQGSSGRSSCGGAGVRGLATCRHRPGPDQPRVSVEPKVLTSTSRTKGLQTMKLAGIVYVPSQTRNCESESAIMPAPFMLDAVFVIILAEAVGNVSKTVVTVQQPLGHSTVGSNRSSSQESEATIYFLKAIPGLLDFQFKSSSFSSTIAQHRFNHGREPRQFFVRGILAWMS